MVIKSTPLFILGTLYALGHYLEDTHRPSEIPENLTWEEELVPDKPMITLGSS